MTTKYYVIEHNGQFISRFCYDVTLVVEDLSSARLFRTVGSGPVHGRRAEGYRHLL
jgi:hypothetical protein